MYTQEQVDLMLLSLTQRDIFDVTSGVPAEIVMLAQFASPQIDSTRFLHCLHATPGMDVRKRRYHWLHSELRGSIREHVPTLSRAEPYNRNNFLEVLGTKRAAIPSQYCGKNYENIVECLFQLEHSLLHSASAIGYNSDTHMRKVLLSWVAVNSALLARKLPIVTTLDMLDAWLAIK